jgi:hypothetical protein
MLTRDQYRAILKLWDQWNSREQILAKTGISLEDIEECLRQFNSLAQYQTYLDEQRKLDRRVKGKRWEKGHRKTTDEQFKLAVQDSRSIAQVLEKLGLRPAGGNYVHTKKRIAELGLDTAHFSGKGWLKDSKHPNPARRPLEEILVKDSDFLTTSRLKTRLITEGVFEPRCTACGLDTWLGSAIPLELDHINGDNRDHRIENLRLLCPNCHARTPTYRARNKGARPS